MSAAYFASGKLGLDLAFATSSVTAIWPPTGIALAALVLGGQRLWPAVALGAFATNVHTGIPAVTVLGITAGNTLEAVAGAYLLRRFANFRPDLERVRDVLSLVAYGAFLSTIVSATIGVTSLLLGDAIAFADVPRVWRTWWLGDMGGDLIVAPALLVAARFRTTLRLPGRVPEAVVLTLALSGVCVVLFSQHTNLVYVVFPFLIWAALRFWQLGAALASLVVAAFAVAFTAHGHGPFAMSGPDERLLLAQTFVGVGGITALVLAALTRERRVAERAVREIAGTLQESLRPALLPEIAGLASAASFRPAGEGLRVGGDFYDLFEAGDGSWALVVGDVCGKGSRAAALTALARYTVRASAAHVHTPGRVLAQLNDAVAHQCEPTEFCTALYARLDVDGSGTTATVSSGGHPLPLLVRAGGDVEQVGRPGTLLGVVAEPLLAEHSVVLGPGDALVLYTDGLIDAQAPRVIIQRPALEAVLRSHAGQTPAQIVGALEDAFLPAGPAQPRDDVAIVVVQAAAGVKP